MLNKILIVEDEQLLAKILKFDLETAGFQVTVATDGEKALQFINKDDFLIAIVDWMMPIMDGIEFIKRLKIEKKDVMVVLLTAKTNEFDVIEGLSSGADLYLKKPISNRELIAQIKALIELRKKDSLKESKVLSIGDISLNYQTYKVTIHHQEVKATKMQFDLLKLFLENKFQALSRDYILNTLWGFDYDGSTRIVDVHINNLKKLIAPSQCQIKALRGVGYSLLFK
jgi:DNA-binding response OmpR family regulator